MSHDEAVLEIVVLAIDDACVGADAEGLERAAERVLDHLTEAGYRVVKRPPVNGSPEWKAALNAI